MTKLFPCLVNMERKLMLVRKDEVKLMLVRKDLEEVGISDGLIRGDILL